jgi:hypothetical protein
MPGPPEPKNASVDKNKQDKAAADKAAADKAAADKANNNKKNDEKKKDSGGGDDDDKGEGPDKGSLDEKGNPFPIKNPEGGDPICPGGYKIDYQFDPINDPINPLFRCIPALKDPNDGVAGKLLAMANNPAGGVQNLATGNIPAFGGKRRHGRGRGRGTKRRTRAPGRTRSRRGRRTRRRSRRTHRHRSS